MCEAHKARIWRGSYVGDHKEADEKEQYLLHVLQNTLSDIDNKGQPISKLIPEVIEEIAQQVSSPVSFEEYENVDW